MYTWRAASAYFYVLHLDRLALAWEYLRRNPDYRHDWREGKLKDRYKLLTRWGCSIPEDPELDARVAQPCWIPDPPDVVRVTASEKTGTSSRAFSVWNLPGQRRILHTSTHLELQTTCGTSGTRLRIDPSVTEGDPFAYVIHADELLCERLYAVNQHDERLKRVETVDPTRVSVRFNRNALVHARALQAVDGAHAGATHRDIAIAIFGESDVAERWTPDSELRAQVRHLIRRGLRFVSGDYRSLLTYVARRRQGEFES